ncbi:MAG TPA: HDOD domain-containing protein [Chromatiales bacterium]|nr:HDOD domain-containing protein [Chromatiales bacterium]
MANSLIEKFCNDLVADIKANKVSLPALPEVALKARKLLNEQGTTSHQISKVISADAVITTRLLRAVNSPLYRTRSQVEDVKMAITRLGNANVRNLVTSLAMEQLYQSGLSDEVKQKLKENWKHSLHVASLSFVIARDYTQLTPDEAMLSGLIHDIGVLPILEYAELLPDILSNKAALDRLVFVLHTKIGHLVLKKWNFPEELVTVAREHENFERDTGINPDYTDVVLVANLLSHVGSDHPHTKLDWNLIPAFNRLAMTPEESIAAIKDAHDEIIEIQNIFSQ